MIELGKKTLNGTKKKLLRKFTKICVEQGQKNILILFLKCRNDHVRLLRSSKFYVIHGNDFMKVLSTIANHDEQRSTIHGSVRRESSCSYAPHYCSGEVMW